MAEVAPWVRACRSPVVPGTGIHAMALTPLVLWAVWWSWTNFVLTLLSTAVFVALELRGRRPAWLVARTKSRLRGQFVAARPVWYLRRRSRLHTYAALKPAQAWSASLPVQSPGHARSRSDRPSQANRTSSPSRGDRPTSRSDR